MHVTFVCFSIFNTKHSPSKIIVYHREWHFTIVMGFQNANENEFNGFGNLVMWLWKSYANFSKGVCAKLL